MKGGGVKKRTFLVVMAVMAVVAGLSAAGATAYRQPPDGDSPVTTVERTPQGQESIPARWFAPGHPGGPADE
jgi:hypothetical protein